MIIGYMILYIHRPFEIWPWIADLRVERVYAILMLCALFFNKRLEYPNIRTAWSLIFFSGVIALSYLFSPWLGTETVNQTIIEWIKQLALFAVIVLTIRRDRDLRLLFLGFALALAIYLGHSVWEYFHGRHSWRGTTSRICGINETFYHAGSVSMLALLGLMMVPLLWRNYPQRWIRLATAGYTLMATYTVLFLAGSRTGFAGLLFFFGSFILRSGRTLRYALLLCCCAPIVWGVMPDDKKAWLNTIWTREDESAQTRSGDFYTGLTLLNRFPILGCGPGAWQKATGNSLVSHNLYGQMLGEVGLLGTFAFFLLISSIVSSCWRISKSELEHPDEEFLKSAAVTILWNTLLLLFLGMAGGTLYRFTWIYMAAFAVAIQDRFDSLQHESAFEDCEPVEHEPLLAE